MLLSQNEQFWLFLALNSRTRNKRVAYFRVNSCLFQVIGESLFTMFASLA